MTVKQLIEELQKMPQDKEVVNASNSMNVESVEEAKDYYVFEEKKDVVLVC